MDLLKEKFIQTDSEYTPYPFWFWNSDFSEENIRMQIQDFYKKGVNGFVLHPRIGIPQNIKYLGDEFFHYVEFAVKTAKEFGMRVILYDEGMYPSGSANGRVVRDYPEYASKGIYVVEKSKFVKRSDRFQEVILSFDWDITNKTIIRGNEYYLVHEDSMGTIRGIHFGEDDGERNAPRSTDLLNTKAIKYFISLTHDRYYQKLKKYFGNTILGFFTDEPAILGRNPQKEMLPYNYELQNLLNKRGITINKLPMLFILSHASEEGQSTETYNKLRSEYNSCVIEQLGKSYYYPISTWCKEKNIFLTGHPHDAHDIGLLKYFQVPGQDVVWRWIAPENNLGIKGYESVTAKCSADAARHAMRKRNLNECFGCCGANSQQWSFTADEMKWYLDWLFIRGVNMIVPHAFFYSIDGKRMEDRPPDVGRHNLWWNHFKYFSNYIKRMSFMMSDQVNQTNIAVLCEKDFLPYKKIEHLYENQIEFNYLEDTYLYEKIFSIRNGGLQIANQNYTVIIVDTAYSRKKELEEVLLEFIDAGGSLIFLQENKRFDYIIPLLKSKYNNSLTISGKELKSIRYSEFMKSNRRFFALSNEGDEEISLTLSFINIRKSVEIWFPWEGSVKTMPLNDGDIQLNLPRRTIVFLTASSLDSDEEDDNNIYFPYFKGLSHQQVLDISITTNNENISAIGTWTANEQMKYFSGTVLYKLNIESNRLLRKNIPENLILDLRKVKNIVTLYIDSQKRETRLFSPYIFSVKKSELIDSNIELEVTNTLSNKYDHNSLISGLLESPIIRW